MSEKSFAVASIAAAVICGTFFYPPPPANMAPTVVPTDAATVTAPHKPALPQALGQKVAMLKTDDAAKPLRLKD